MFVVSPFLLKKVLLTNPSESIEKVDLKIGVFQVSTVSSFLFEIDIIRRVYLAMLMKYI